MPHRSVWVAYHPHGMWARLGRVLGDDGPMGRSLAAIVGVAAWVATWRPQVDPDAWWHIALGDVIVGSGTIPTVESFSWLSAGDRIVVHSWLWDVLLASAHGAGGETGTSLLILPVTGAIVVLLWSLVRTVAPAIPPLGAAAAVLAATTAGLPAWAPRAQTLDMAFVLASVLMLARYLRRGERSPLLALLIIGVVWANLHGSAVLALPVCIGIALIAAPIGTRRGDWPRRSPALLLAAAAGASIAAMVNPHGPGLLLYPTDRAIASAFIPEIVEWRPPDLGAVELLPFDALVVVAAAIVARRQLRGDPFLMLTAGGWTFVALSSARFVAIAGCLLVVAIAAALGAGRRRVATREPAAVVALPAAVLWATTAAVIAAVVLAGWTLISPAAQDAAIRHRLPVDAVAAVESMACPGRVLADYGWGGYVIWSTGRDVGAYGNSAEAVVREQVAVERATPDPEPWLDDHAVDVIVMPSGGPLSMWLDSAIGWTERYRDERATIHVRDAAGCSLEG